MSDIDVIYATESDNGADNTSNFASVGDLSAEIDGSLVLISWIIEYSGLRKHVNPQNWHTDSMLNQKVGQLENRVYLVIDQVNGLMGKLSSFDQESSNKEKEEQENPSVQLEASSVELINQKIQQLLLALTSVCECLEDKFDLSQLKRAQQVLSKFPDQINMFQNVEEQNNKKKKKAKKKKEGRIRQKWEQFKSAVLRKEAKHEQVR